MITSNTEAGLHKATDSFNQPVSDKQGCGQSSESKQQRQEFSDILKTLNQQNGN